MDRIQEVMDLSPVSSVPRDPTNQRLEMMDHALHVPQERVPLQQGQHHFLDVMVNHGKTQSENKIQVGHG